MAGNEHPDSETSCVNCGSPVQGRFCSQCGEKRLQAHDFAFSHLLEETFEGLAHADTRFLRSFKYLMTRPGFLSAEYLRGRRVPYMKPLGFFLIINLFYFLTLGFNSARTFETPLRLQYQNPYGELAVQLVDAHLGTASPEERTAFESHFDHQNHNLSKSLLLLLAPLLALTLWLLYGRRRPYFAQHFVTALHFLSGLLVINMVVGIVLRGGLVPLLFGYTPITHLFSELIEPLLWVGIFVYFTLKNVYEESVGRTLLKAVVYTVMWMPILIAYRFLIFLITLYSI